MIGHALRVVARCAATIAGKTVEVVTAEAGPTFVAGTSLKASMDIGRYDEDEQHKALQKLLDDVQKRDVWPENVVIPDQRKQAPLQDAVAQLQHVLQQDLVPDPNAGDSGAARDQPISIGGPSMWHGRTARSTTIQVFKWFIAKDLDHCRILGVTVQPANQPEREATQTLKNRQGHRARYTGVEQNVFDLSRYAFIGNRCAIDRMEQRAA